MKLFPQHLRDNQHALIIRRRTYGLRGKGDYGGMNVDTMPFAERKIGVLGKQWIKGTRLNDRQAATGLSAAAMATQTAIWLAPATVGFVSLVIGTISLAKHGNAEPLAVSAALTGGLSYLSALPLARWAFRWCYKPPLVAGEIEQLLDAEQGTTTELEKSYLRLVHDAVRQTTDVTPQTEAEVQAAIASLGEAIDRLPPITVTPVDTAALRAEAETLHADALLTADRVISESLERRADALIRRADASERSALAARRTAALRAEIEAQIAALRDGIAALGIGDNASDTGAAQNLQHLGESARRLAVEATSAVSARAELDAATSDAPRTYADVTPAEPTRLSVGRGGANPG